MMIDAEQLTELYFERLGPSMKAVREDAVYHAQMTFLRDTVRRIGIVLEDEGIPDETAERIVRGVLYGAPTDEAARQRMREHEERTQWLIEKSREGIVRPDELGKLFGMMPGGGGGGAGPHPRTSYGFGLGGNEGGSTP